MKIMKKSSKLFVVLVATVSISLLTGNALAKGIKVLDPQYKAVTLVKDAPLSGCNGATIGPDGALYVTQVSSNTVSRIDLNTMKATTFVPPYGGMYIGDDITADDKGNFYVSGITQLSNEVYRIDKNGVKTVIARGITGANGIEYNRRTGRLFLTECFWGNRVFELDPTGVKPPKVLIDKNVIPIPEGFDFDPDTDDLIIPDMATGGILRVNPDTGKFTTIAEKFIVPVALAVGGPGNLAYIIELPTGVVWSLTLDGKERKKIAQLLPGVDNLAITKEGRLFVTSYWDATVWEVSIDGSGKYKTLFPMGCNQPSGILVKDGKILVSDWIMVREVKNGKYVKTKINAWAAHGMPLPGGLADGPGTQLFWPDAVNDELGMGNLATGKFKIVAKGLKGPTGMLMSKTASKVYVAEYGAGKITEVCYECDGCSKVLTSGLEGPLALTMVDNTLYVAEAKAGKISKVDPATGKKEVFVSGVVGKPGALCNDGAGNLLVIDGASHKLYKIGTKDLSISVVAKNLPVSYMLSGSYPSFDNALPMTVSAEGDIYFTTANRGVIKLEKVK
jgi:sugar lactone lactonase YvrE